MIFSPSIAALTKSLVAAKKEFKPIHKGKENPAFKRDGIVSKYADLAGAIEATEAALTNNGLAVMQFPLSTSDGIGVWTLLLHESGDYIGDSFVLPVVKKDPQGGVATITYARRAGYLAILGVAAEDDDGNEASGKQEASKPTRTAPGKKKPEPNSTQAEAKKPPKAEIPSSAPPSGEPVTGEKPGTISAGSSDALPTPEELSKFRQKFVAFRKELEEAGLKDRQKSLTFICTITGKSKPEEITVGQWQAFFSRAESFKNTNGIEALVQKIEEDAQ